MCRIIPMAWFWPFITPFMKIFACGGLTISFKALFLMKKLLSKITCAAGEKNFGIGRGVTPLWFEKFTPPPQERKPHPPLGFWTLSTCDRDNPSIPACRPIETQSFTYTGLLPKMATRGTLAKCAQNTFSTKRQTGTRPRSTIRVKIKGSDQKTPYLTLLERN